MNPKTPILLASLMLALAGPFAHALQPTAHWPLDELNLPHEGELRVIADAGPSAPAFPAMAENNAAIAFNGKGAFLRIPDSENLRFGNEDSITIETWVNCETIGSGQHAYLIGKGRTAAEADNQNWALRLTGAGGNAAKISFLFRSRDGENHEGAYHRWTSETSFPAGGWYHVAVRYTFGQPESVRGYIDGQRAKGKWDMGGETKHPPVVDDAEIWIGSARGGEAGNSFHGRMADIAVYRALVPDAEIAERGRYVQEAVPPRLDAIPPGKVLAEIFEGAGSPKQWPRLSPEPNEILSLDALALLELPHVYTDGGVRRDRKLPLYVRLATSIELPPGELELLFRAPGLARLTIDGQEITNIDSFTLPRNGHNELRPQPVRDDCLPPRVPPGSRETMVSFSSNGGRHLVVAETLLGRPGIRFAVNQFLVARRHQDRDHDWKLLAPEPVEFDSVSLEKYRRAQKIAFEALDAERRAKATAATADFWKNLHRQAKGAVSSLPTLTIPGDASQGTAIDRFLHAKIEQARKKPKTATSSQSHQALTLLEKNCQRCHGEKEKGGLRLDSPANALEGGESGEPGISPGHPDKSQLMSRILSEDGDERMPPKGDGLTEDEILTLRDWIADGAEWPAGPGEIHVPARAEPLPLLRRVYLDTVGELPPADVCRRFEKEKDPEAWNNLIDQLLDDPRHAGHWVSYWQDVLAENPRLVKGKLNNTGPFRWWIYESLRDNKPFDQFVTELITFAGSKHGGGAGGFGIATQNDVPMAAKAHVIGTAFLGMEMKCARCHDAPYHSTTQKDLFSIAAMLENKSIELPASSTVPTAFFQDREGRKSLIQASLKAGAVIPSEWPFARHANAVRSDDSLENSGRNARELLAREITHPANRRFAQVIVNRLWQRYFGQGIVEPVHDWEGQTPSHPALLDFLAREFVSSGYDLRHVHRMILKSRAYQRATRLQPVTAAEDRFFEAPLRRRMTAEQLVDSLFAATGVPFYSEELSYDPEGAHPPDVMQSLGVPRRAWQLNAVSSERDRPSLTLPKASSILAVMEAFGWRANRSEPVSGSREVPEDVLQPGMLGNGLFGLWQTRLSDYSDLTGLAVKASSPSQLIKELYLRFLTRLPTTEEHDAFVRLIAPGFDERLTDPSGTYEKAVYVPEVREVTWANHLKVKANLLAAEIERETAEGPPPTEALEPGWRQRLEDMVWALVNSPEMQFIP